MNEPLMTRERLESIECRLNDPALAAPWRIDSLSLELAEIKDTKGNTVFVDDLMFPDEMKSGQRETVIRETWANYRLASSAPEDLRDLALALKEALEGLELIAKEACPGECDLEAVAEAAKMDIAEGTLCNGCNARATLNRIYGKVANE